MDKYFVGQNWFHFNGRWCNFLLLFIKQSALKLLTLPPHLPSQSPYKLLSHPLSSLQPSDPGREGTTPALLCSSSSMHILSYLSTAALVTSCLKVATAPHFPAPVVCSSRPSPACSSPTPQPLLHQDRHLHLPLYAEVWGITISDVQGFLKNPYSYKLAVHHLQINIQHR